MSGAPRATRPVGGPAELSRFRSGLRCNRPDARAGFPARCRVGGRRQRRAAVPTGQVSSRRHLEPCMRFSRTRLSDVLHRRHSAAPVGVGLGRPVERPLQFSDSVLLGGRSHRWHSPALPCTRRANEAAALPLTPGSVVPRAQAVLRPPPTPSRHATRFPAQHRL